MSFKTLDQIRTKISRDLDIEEEEFIQPDEIIEYINDAISEAEAHIINLGLRDKYFLAKASLDIVQGEEDIALPTNIYSNKIFKLVYKNGNEIYTIKPIDSQRMYEDIEVINQSPASQNYSYLIRHDTPGEEVIQIIPPARETLSGVIKCWYYRDANRLEADDDICDLPEIAIQFVYQSVRVRVYEKEKGQPWMVALQELEKVKSLMVETLQQQIVDSDLTKAEQDMTIYEEHS